MEIHDNSKKGFISVWLTKSEQELYDRAEITRILLSKTKGKKCRVVFFLSGKEQLYPNIEKLLLFNLK